MFIYLKQCIRLAIYTIVLNSYSGISLAQEEQQSTQALSIAAYHARGNFGLPEQTEISYLPLRYEFDNANWGFQLLMPHLQVQGPGAVLINLGGVSRAVAGSEVRTESGLGDVVGSLIYHLPARSATSPFIDLRFDVKLPTADKNEGLGTGETDYSLQLDISQYWRDWILFGSVGYTYRGNSSLFPDLESGGFAQLGAAKPLDESLSLGFIYDYRQRATSFTSDIHELGPYLNWQFNESWSITALTMAGFTDASSDFSVLAQLRYSW